MLHNMRPWRAQAQIIEDVFEDWVSVGKLLDSGEGSTCSG